MYSDFSARAFLRYMADVKQLPRKQAKQQIEELLALVNLQEVAHKKLGDGAAVAADSPLVAQGIGKGNAQRNADVLHGVVIVHLSVALAGDDQIEPSVFCEEGQHMIQKAAAGFDLGNAGSVQIQSQKNIRFGGGPLDVGSSHAVSSRISFMAVMNAAICCSSPMVTRM